MSRKDWHEFFGAMAMGAFLVTAFVAGMAVHAAVFP